MPWHMRPAPPASDGLPPPAEDKRVGMGPLLGEAQVVSGDVRWLMPPDVKPGQLIQVTCLVQGGLHHVTVPFGAEEGEELNTEAEAAPAAVVVAQNAGKENKLSDRTE